MEGNWWDGESVEIRSGGSGKKRIEVCLSERSRGRELWWQ